MPLPTEHYCDKCGYFHSAPECPECNGALATTPCFVIIDGVRYVPENSESIPNRASFWYMHDNHTFSRIDGTLEEIIEQAKGWGLRSSYGMLCPVTLLRDEKEIRRLKRCAHSRPNVGLNPEDLAAWIAEVEADEDTMRILSQNT